MYLAIGLVSSALGFLVYLQWTKPDPNAPEEPLIVTEQVNFKKYYDDVKFGEEKYAVLDVYMRSENNFLQGLYFDKDERALYESAGVYGQSHIQKLKITDGTLASLRLGDQEV